ncbi:hypothetical protein CsatB_007105 [Cannabis sativa]
MIVLVFAMVIEKPCQELNIDSLETPLVHYPKPKNYSRAECACNPVRYFTILSMQRSGSGWFETLLNNHTNISSNGEVFSVKVRRSNISTIVETLDRIYNLDWFSSASKNECTAAVGLKWMLNQSRVLKKTLNEGEGYERHNDGTVVQVKLTGKLHDGTVFTRKGHDDGKSYEFKIDEEKVIGGLDRAVKNMKKGEVALVTIHPEYTLGSSDSSQDLAVVLANSVVYYEIELVSFVKGKESWDMNTQEKIEAAGKKKEEGNALFKAGKYERASKRYEKAVSFVKYDSSFSDEEKQQAKVLKMTCNLNNAACKLKLKDYKQAEKLCTKVLDLDSKNVKALYRRAQAYIQLVDLDLVEIDIKKALEIEPDNICENGVKIVERKSEGIQQEGCRILQQHICKDEQV